MKSTYSISIALWSLIFLVGCPDAAPNRELRPPVEGTGEEDAGELEDRDTGGDWEGQGEDAGETEGGGEEPLPLGALCASDSKCLTDNCRATPAGHYHCTPQGHACSDGSGGGLNVGQGVCEDQRAQTCIATDNFQRTNCALEPCEEVTGRCVAGSCVCPDGCTNHTECQDGNYCHDDQVCVPLEETGDPCTLNLMCLSDNCRLSPTIGERFCVQQGMDCADAQGNGLASGQSTCVDRRLYTCEGRDFLDVLDCPDLCLVDSCCTRNCSGRECGDDECGGVCGQCGHGQTCNAQSGQCEEDCIPQCAGRQCGDDGCGDVCGTCGGATPICNLETGQCEEEDQVDPGWVRIEPGTFMMGSPEDEPGRTGGDDDNSEDPLHQVTITRPFLMKDTEVTQDEWFALMGTAPSHFSTCGGSCPAESISWFEAAAFCNALSNAHGLTPCYRTAGGAEYDINHATNDTNVTWPQGLDCNGYRLPTEAEWEYAARAGSEGMYNPPNLDQAAWYAENSSNRTHIVGTKAPNTWGLYDMHGNVWEWTWDAEGPYPVGPVTDPLGPASPAQHWIKKIRGGSFKQNAASCRAARRARSSNNQQLNNLGMRPVRTVLP